MSKLDSLYAKLKPSVKLSFTLVLIAISAILFVDMVGLVPNSTENELKNRKQLSESIAILFASQTGGRSFATLKPVLEDVKSRNENLQSLGYRAGSGRLEVVVGDHITLWQGGLTAQSTPEQIAVPILRSGRRVGTLELVFVPLHEPYGVLPLDPALVKLCLATAAFLLFFYTFFFMRTSRHVEATGAVPNRVNSAFDTLAEGVIILDDTGQVVLSNSSFVEAAQLQQDELEGKQLDYLDWHLPGNDSRTPWDITLSTGEPVVGQMVELAYSPVERRSFMVNAAAIRGENDRDVQGVLITFDDVTELESQKQQLQVLVSSLESSKRDIQRKNTELEYLATRDPLTGTLNRRSYNAQFEQLFTQCRESGTALSCVMVDIDHFKSVNDRFGHAVGDEVIKAVADQLKAVTRSDDIVGRYGGEEFSLILPGMEVATAFKVAERVRESLKSLDFSKIAESLHISASMGVAALSDNPKSPAQLNDMADKALYVAKQTGRDRVVVWEEAQGAEVSDEAAKRISISDHARYESEIHKLENQLHELEDVAASYSQQAYQAQYFDILTGLPNRALFFDRVAQEIERTQRLGTVTAFMLIDFDLFEKVNHRFGRAVADTMFAELVERLVSLLRRTDSVTVLGADEEDGMTISRFSNSEIGILLTDLNGREGVTWVAQRVFNALRKPLSYNDEAVEVSCNIAVSVAPDDAESVEALIANADTAMSHARLTEQQNSLQFFDAEMQRASREQLKLEAEIREATEKGQWQLYYQPKVSSQNCKIVGVEALIRWNHPERGLLAPFHFIEFAESRGLICDIGRWVIRDACRQIREWGQQGIKVPVAVNLSAVQLRREGFADEVFECLAEHGLTSDLLELEVTETAMVEEDDISRGNLEALHRGGVAIAIDDFGTGYSSLGYLKSLPVNTLKIDRAFIADIARDSYDREIVVSVIALAHGLNLSVVAEGVEELEQFELLRHMNCDDIQGYLLSRPVPASDITSQLLGESLDVFKQAS